jgi:divalent metal cation (Fe/Co/Zn/Cd) transporter
LETRFSKFAFKLNLYRYTTAVAKAAEGVALRAEIAKHTTDRLAVGLALFTTLFCSQNTVQLMTVSMVRPCN